MDKLEKKYNKLFATLETLNSDPEASHIHSENIYTTFINDIRTKKFQSIEDIISISTKINKNVIKKKITKWYA
jgi:hypothetical protein